MLVTVCNHYQLFGNNCTCFNGDMRPPSFTELQSCQIVYGGLIIGIISLGMELIALRLLVAKLLRQMSAKNAADALNELRQSGNLLKVAKGK